MTHSVFDAKVKTALQMVVTAAPLLLAPLLAALHASQRLIDNAALIWIGAVWFLAVLTVWTALPYWRAARAHRGG